MLISIIFRSVDSLSLVILIKSHILIFLPLASLSQVIFSGLLGIVRDPVPCRERIRVVQGEVVLRSKHWTNSDLYIIKMLCGLWFFDEMTVSEKGFLSFKRWKSKRLR